MAPGTPETRYARAGDGAYLAYQRFGAGPVTMVVVPGQATHLEHQWDFPVVVHWLRRMARFAEVVTFDARGCGLSDRALGDPEGFVEEFAGDIGAVMDAAGVERAAVYAQFHSTPACIRFAVDHPERVSHLVVDGGYARWRRAPEIPDGMREDVADRFVENVTELWGTGATIDAFAPALAADERQREAWGQYERMASSPGHVHALMDRWTHQDVRDLLGRVAVPTLVLHRAGDQLVRVGHGRYLAEHLPDVRYVEAPGGDHVQTGAALGELLGEVADFVVGTRDAVQPDRTVTTVVFVDIASSTEEVSRMGDLAWRGLLDDFRRIVRREVERFGGREVNTRGDDFLVCFQLPSVAIAAARSIRDAVGDLGLAVRTGIHLGEVELQGDDVAGLTVHVAARVAELAGANQILVSGTVGDAVVGSDVACVDLGEHLLKGIPRTWRVLAVE
jgi:class 3 adenylate cyclase/alpha-beta hydrolase superfamily lysophospholipase